ncbi:MAG: FmdE family protein [Methanomicrobiales archaeon]|jgi:formylmethanofuran dehydrogenase subunit E|nr:FmdE family protein [Methanomicrobiales archaeon]
MSTHNESQSTERSFASFEEVVTFHGHLCLGLVSGYQMAVAAMKALDVSRPDDEELVAVAESDSCAVDAVQIVTGCTSGKGNLIIHDHGKHVISFYSRTKQKAVRVVSNLDKIRSEGELLTMSEVIGELRTKIRLGEATPEEEKELQKIMAAAAYEILSYRPEDVVSIQEIPFDPPQEAQIFQSIACESCGELVADAKTNLINGKRVCVPCREKLMK